MRTLDRITRIMTKEALDGGEAYPLAVEARGTGVAKNMRS